MEQVFSQKIFRKKRNTSRGIPLFSFSPELPENHCIIYFITLVPCSLAKKISDFAREWRPPSCLSVQKKEYLQRYSSFFVFTGITGKSLYHLLYHTSTMLLGKKNKRFRSRMAPSFMFECPICGFHFEQVKHFLKTQIRGKAILPLATKCIDFLGQYTFRNEPSHSRDTATV